MTVQPVMAAERTVFYRERAASYYSAVPYTMVRGQLGRALRGAGMETGMACYGDIKQTVANSKCHLFCCRILQATGVVELPYLAVQAILMVLVTT